MDSLFSHGAGPSTDSQEAPPATITAEVTIPRGVDDAFAGFTDGLHLWWPADQTRLGEGTHPEFTDGELLEEDQAGRTALWATVLDVSEEGLLKLAWHHQGNPHFSSRVSLSFTPFDGHTRVAVEHRGWAQGELGHEQAAAAPDWLAALAAYRRFMGGAA